MRRCLLTQASLELVRHRRARRGTPVRRRKPKAIRESKRATGHSAAGGGTADVQEVSLRMHIQGISSWQEILELTVRKSRKTRTRLLRHAPRAAVLRRPRDRRTPHLPYASAARAVPSVPRRPSHRRRRSPGTGAPSWCLRSSSLSTPCFEAVSVLCAVESCTADQREVRVYGVANLQCRRKTGADKM